jgi:DNA-binding transcriptional regulator YiaG
MSASKQRKTVRLPSEQVRAKHDQEVWKRFDAATEEDIARWQLEDGYNEAEEGPLHGVAVIKPGIIPETDVRALREYLDLSQEEFARRYYLPLEDVQAWEQHIRKPDGAARNFLWLISRNPSAVADELTLPPLAAA